MQVSLIVAQADNGVIGIDKNPWHLPCDLKYFKRVQPGKRLSWAAGPLNLSVGRWLRNVVVTRNRDWSALGVRLFQTGQIETGRQPSWMALMR